MKTLPPPIILVSLPAVSPETAPAVRELTSDALGQDLERLQQLETAERDRRREAELARLRELARFD